MPHLEWEESFSVGNGEIDSQHKRWIAVINELHDALMQGTAAKVDDITLNALGAMKEYADMHFAYEEAYMKSIGYPDLPYHVTLHRDFYTRIEQFRRDMRSGDVVLNTDLMNAMMNWLRNHILREDMKFSRFGKEKE